jgi:hypothetical protein
MNEGWTNKKIRASDCVDYAFTYARREWKTILPLLLIFHVPFTIIRAMTMNSFVIVSLLEDTYDDAFAALGIIMMTMLSSTITTLYYAIFIHVIDGGLIYSTYRYTVFGDRPGLKRRVSRGFRELLQSIVFELLASAAISGIVWILYIILMSVIARPSTGSGYEFKDKTVITLFALYFGTAVIIIIISIYLSLRFTYMSQFALIENKGVFAAMGASWKATKGKMRRLLSIYVVTIIVSSGIETAIGALQAFSVFTSNFVTVLFGAILAVFSGLGYFFGTIAITFSFIHDMPDNDLRKQELAVAAYLRENDQ